MLDVLTVDAQAPALFGANEEFLASARLDNLSSVHAEVQALITIAGGEQALPPHRPSRARHRSR